MEKLVAKGRHAKFQERKPRFYEFHQNNSGGTFDYDDDRGIAELVIVEAYSADEATSTAKSIGLYFGGGYDCECCGDRWSEPWSDDSGYAFPSHYGGALEEVERGYGRRFREEERLPYAYVHYLNGTIEGWG